MLSLTMIVKNGEEHIAQTLVCAKEICDEMIVVDTGSTDKTVEIAKSYGAKVFHFDWIDDFSAARNEAIRHATGDWLIWLDCGDVIPPQAIEGFKNLKMQLKTNKEVDFVWCNINRGITDEGVVVFKFNTPRFWRASVKTKWIGAVHEYLDRSNENALIWADAWVDDPLAMNNTPTERNIKILRGLLDKGDDSPRTAYYYANELRDHKRWDEAIEAYDHFLSLNHFTWEYYDALVSQANCYRQGDPERTKGGLEKAVDCYFKAMQFTPIRAEAYVALGDISYEAQRWDGAVPFYRAVIGMKRPMEGFVIETAYTWLPWDRLSICYGNMGLLEEAVEATERCLREAPPSEWMRLCKNLTMYHQAIQQNRQNFEVWKAQQQQLLQQQQDAQNAAKQQKALPPAAKQVSNGRVTPKKVR